MQCRMRKLSASISSAAYSLVCGSDCDLSCGVCRMSALYKGVLQWHWCRYRMERPSHSSCVCAPQSPALAPLLLQVGGTYARPMLLPPEVAIGAFGRVRVSPTHTHTQPCQLLNCVTHVEGVAQFTDGDSMLGGRHIVHLLV